MKRKCRYCGELEVVRLGMTGKQRYQPHTLDCPVRLKRGESIKVGLERRKVRDKMGIVRKR